MKNMDMLQLRVDHLERSVSQKADEVVAAQLYQQRQELEELRRMVTLLADAVEGMRQVAPSHAEELRPEPQKAIIRPGAGAVSARAKKRKRFWLFGG
jgi:chromosome-anchoring protein RacA